MFELYRKNKMDDNASSFSQDAVVNAISEFVYDPEEDITFVPVFPSIGRYIQNRLHHLDGREKSLIVT